MLIETLGTKVITYFTDPDKGIYKDLRIHHSLDMWHGAKNLCKKIATVSYNTNQISLIMNCTFLHVDGIILLCYISIKIFTRNNFHCLCFINHHKAGKVKGQSLLLHWLRDIVNHFWWCCKTAETFQQFLVSRRNVIKKKW